MAFSSLGIGSRTAVVAFALYALLLILRNTFTVVSSVDEAVDGGRRSERQVALEFLVEKAWIDPED